MGHQDNSPLQNATRAKSLEVGRSVRVNIAAACLWNRSGVFVEAGHRIAFRVVEVSDWRDSSIMATPDGQINVPWFLNNRLARRLLRHREAEWYELVGCVGRKLNYAFRVGRSADVTITQPGELFFFANDAPWAYGNNFGTIGLDLSRIS